MIQLLGLNLVVDMKPHVERCCGIENIPYNIKISTKTGVVDQKRGQVELRPGYRVIIRVTPAIIKTSKSFQEFDTQTRNCKLSDERGEFTILQNYSLAGCEFECAMNRALEISQCLPWFYPNNFSTVPMCDMFGANYFDNIMSDNTYYKNCSTKCLEDCESTTYAAIPSYVPIDTGICLLPRFKKYFEDILYESGYNFRSFEYVTTGKGIYNRLFLKK